MQTENSKARRKIYQSSRSCKGLHPRSYVGKMKVFRGNKEAWVGEELTCGVKVLEDGGEGTGGKQVAQPPVSPRLVTLFLRFWCLRVMHMDPPRKEYY